MTNIDNEVLLFTEGRKHEADDEYQTGYFRIQQETEQEKFTNISFINVY